MMNNDNALNASETLINNQSETGLSKAMVFGAIATELLCCVALLVVIAGLIVWLAASLVTDLLPAKKARIKAAPVIIWQQAVAERGV